MTENYWVLIPIAGRCEAEEILADLGLVGYIVPENFVTPEKNFKLLDGYNLRGKRPSDYNHS